jgi:hypothetical protein
MKTKLTFLLSLTFLFLFSGSHVLFADDLQVLKDKIEKDVIVDGESIGDLLVEAGMAVRYDGGRKTHKWCE